MYNAILLRSSLRKYLMRLWFGLLAFLTSDIL